MELLLSVVVATDTFDAIEELVASLRAQTARDRVELVVVTPSSVALALPEQARHGFGGVQVLEVGETDFELLYRARAAGVRAASAPVIVFAETHCFPEPDWARALIEAHEADWTGVCPAFANANPSGTISWSNLVIDYGRWLAPGREGPISEVPGHNSSFKRAALVAYGDRLDELIVQDKLLIDDLRAHGHRFYFAPAARSRHLNVDRPKSWLEERFVIGWTFAAARSASWPWSRRLLYAGGSPLIPFVRLRRTWRDIHQAGCASDLLPQILPAAFAGLAASALGELLGYALGPSERAARRMSEIEVRRLDHVRPRAGMATGVPELVAPAGSLDAR